MGRRTLHSGPTPKQWNWAARSFEFNAPSPPIRSLTYGNIAPIPAVAEAEMNNERAMMDLDRRAIPAEAELNLDALISERVRFDKRTHFPVASASRGASKTNPVTPDQQLSTWEAKCKGGTESPPEQPRGGHDNPDVGTPRSHRVAPRTDKRKSKDSPDSSLSRSSWRDH